MWFNSKENRYSYRRGNFETFKPAPPYCVSDTLQSHEAVLLAGRANQRDNRCYVRAADVFTHRFTYTRAPVACHLPPSPHLPGSRAHDRPYKHLEIIGLSMSWKHAHAATGIRRRCYRPDQGVCRTLVFAGWLFLSLKLRRQLSCCSSLVSFSLLPEQEALCDRSGSFVGWQGSNSTVQ